MKVILILLSLFISHEQVKWKYDMLERVALRWHAEKIEASYHKPPVITSCKPIEGWTLYNGTPWEQFDSQWPIIFNRPDNTYISKTILQQRVVDGKLQNNRYTLRRVK